MTAYILLFLLFGFLGWIIDSTYCSLGSSSFVFSGYFKYIPICTIYGIGGVLIILLFLKFKDYPFWSVVLYTTLSIILLEYLGGWFCQLVLGERLWDYSNEFLNIHGHISLLYSFYWFFLVGILYFFLNPHMERIHSFISRIQDYVGVYDRFVVVIFFVVFLCLTVYTRDRRLSLYRGYRDGIVLLENGIRSIEKRVGL